jgi:hypothetical protein
LKTLEKRLLLKEENIDKKHEQVELQTRENARLEREMQSREMKFQIAKKNIISSLRNRRISWKLSPA